eukprot:GSA120T00019951001.1
MWDVETNDNGKKLEKFLRGETGKNLICANDPNTSTRISKTAQTSPDVVLYTDDFADVEHFDAILPFFEEKISRNELPLGELSRNMHDGEMHDLLVELDVDPTSTEEPTGTPANVSISRGQHEHEGQMSIANGLELLRLDDAEIPPDSPPQRRRLSEESDFAGLNPAAEVDEDELFALSLDQIPEPESDMTFRGVSGKQKTGKTAKQNMSRPRSKSATSASDDGDDAAGEEIGSLRTAVLSRNRGAESSSSSSANASRNVMHASASTSVNADSFGDIVMGFESMNIADVHDTGTGGSKKKSISKSKNLQADNKKKNKRSTTQPARGAARTKKAEVDNTELEERRRERKAAADRAREKGKMWHSCSDHCLVETRFVLKNAIPDIPDMHEYDAEWGGVSLDLHDSPCMNEEEVADRYAKNLPRFIFEEGVEVKKQKWVGPFNESITKVMRTSRIMKEGWTKLRPVFAQKELQKLQRVIISSAKEHLPGKRAAKSTAPGIRSERKQREMEVVL